VQLEGEDLSGAQLQGVDLSGAHLRGALLRDAQLQGAVLRGAQLQGAVLRGAQLQGADFDGANLDHSRLSSVWTWRAQKADCMNARVADVHALQLFDRSPIPATPDAIRKFIEQSIAGIPNAKVRAKVATRMRNGLIVDPAHDDTEAIANAWSNCTQAETSTMPEEKFLEQLFTVLGFWESPREVFFNAKTLPVDFLVEWPHGLTNGCSECYGPVRGTGFEFWSSPAICFLPLRGQGDAQLL
jgi:hypothetical protein